MLRIDEETAADLGEEAVMDWTGRAVREGKRGFTDHHAPPILERLGLDPERFLSLMAGGALTKRSTMLGRVERIQAAAHELGKRFAHGVSVARGLYLPQGRGA